MWILAKCLKISEMKRILLLLSVLVPAVSALCQEIPAKEDTLTLKKEPSLAYTDEFLDTVNVKKKFIVNDYSLVGVHYGVSYSQTMFNPTRPQVFTFSPKYFGFSYTRYGKLFGYMPYFGMQIGVNWSRQGYKFKEDKETGITPTLEGATKAVIDVIEVPAVAIFHVDMLHFKVMADFGLYGGYRMNIRRYGENVDEAIRTSFADHDKRLEYGLKGGVGFGLVFDPVEFHVMGQLRYSWSSLYEPDYYSKYYYRFAYPLDVIVTAGVYFQLTKRSGKSRSALRKEAYESVYNPVKEEK